MPGGESGPSQIRNGSSNGRAVQEIKEHLGKVVGSNPPRSSARPVAFTLSHCHFMLGFPSRSYSGRSGNLLMRKKLA